MRKLTIDNVRQLIRNSNLEHRPIEFSMDQLRFAFGFKRKDGLEVVLEMYLRNQTEEQVQTLPPMRVHENIENWCKENKIYYVYNIDRDSYTFH